MGFRKTQRRALRPPGGSLDYRLVSDSREQAWLRTRFLTAALAIEPNIVAGLRRLYELLTGDHEYTADVTEDGLIDVTNDPLGGMLDRFNLATNGWIYEWVFHQLQHIFDHPPPPGGQREVVISYPFSEPPHVRVPPLPDLNWNPSERPKEEMQRAYSDYLDSVESIYRQAGYVLVGEKREPRHFVWLAAYQVLGYPICGIADAAGVSRQAVQQGIKVLAAEIGLKLRTSASRRKVEQDEISRRLEWCEAQIESSTDRLNILPARK